MKYLFLAAMLTIAAMPSNGAFLLKEKQMSDLEFTDKLFYNLYDGFVKGLYREKVEHVIDERCLGNWIKTNLTHLDSIAERLANGEFSISFKEASQGAQEIVNLIYANKEYCQISKVIDDLSAFCPNGTCLEDD